MLLFPLPCCGGNGDESKSNWVGVKLGCWTRIKSESNWVGVVGVVEIPESLTAKYCPNVNYCHCNCREMELHAELVLPDEAVAVLGRMQAAVTSQFGGTTSFLVPHVVDLAKDGSISAHTDSIKFSGRLIAGLSLLSERVMRLSRNAESGDNHGPERIDIVLQPRSLYMSACTDSVQPRLGIRSSSPMSCDTSTLKVEGFVPVRLFMK